MTIWRALLVLAGLVLSTIPSYAAPAEKRIALVVGNAAYAAGALPTPANDAGLIAQTLQAAGFDVVGARDLDGESLRRALHDFLDKASSSGPDTVAFIYLAGYGLQLQGDNYFVPVDARLSRVSDVPVEAVRVSDYVRSLAGLGLKAGVVVLDAARASPFLKSEQQPPAGGLALVDPDPGLLVAFNAAPGTIGPPEAGPYGAYAKALAEMMRQAGLALPDVFAQTRLRVGEATQGAELPWDASKLTAAVTLFERGPDAPPPPEAYRDAPRLRSQPVRSFAPAEAYTAAVARDTFQGYQDFLAAFPDDPMAPRVRAILAARREAITWRRTWQTDSPQAYWSYLDRYPHGPHAWDARRRLRELSAAAAPPPAFTAIAYDLPPPPPAEIVYVERPVIVFDDPVWRLPPPPPPPVIFLPPPVVVVVAPPPPPIVAYALPVPVFEPVPRWAEPPRYVVAPPEDELFRNIHERIDPRAPEHGVTAGQVAGAAAAVGAGAALLKVALPPSVARKAQPSPGPRPLPGAAALPGNEHLPAQQALRPPAAAPDMKPVPGKPLPAPPAAPLGKPLEARPGKPVLDNGVKPLTGAAVVPGTVSPPALRARKPPRDNAGPADKQPAAAVAEPVDQAHRTKAAEPRKPDRRPAPKPVPALGDGKPVRPQPGLARDTGPPRPQAKPPRAAGPAPARMRAAPPPHPSAPHPSAPRPGAQHPRCGRPPCH